MASKKPFQISHPGRLKNLAAREGKTVNQVAKQHEGDKGGLGKAARLYENVFKPAAEKRSHGNVEVRGRKKK